MGTLEIFKINQLLFVEAGIVLSSLLVLGVVSPFFGIVYPLIAISTYLVYCFLDVILRQKKVTFEDFIQVFSDEDFPSTSKVLLTSIAIFLVSFLTIIFFNQNFATRFANSYFCTLISSLLGFFAYIFDVNKITKFTSVFLFTLLSAPIMLITLGVGSIVVLPLFYIYLDRRV